MVIKKTIASKKPNKIEEKPVTYPVPDQLTSTPPTPRKLPFFKIAILVLVVAAVLALLVRNKSVLVAGTVNGRPILKWELNQRLSDRFGKQMLEAMVGEYLILDAAQKQNVLATPEEVNARIVEIEKTLAGSMTLDESLALQGVTRAEFTNQVQIQLLIDKMLSRDVSVSAAEVEEFIKGNTASLTASTEADRRLEAEKEIKNNKLSQVFTEWFAKLKEGAQITRYL